MQRNGSRAWRWVLGIAAAVVVGLAPTSARSLPPGGDRTGDGKLVIACLGDSNTTSDWQHRLPGGFPAGEGWCEQLAARFADGDAKTVNVSIPGGTAVANLLLDDNPLQRVFCDGTGQLDYVLDSVPVDAVLLAFGTNDVLPDHDATPEEIIVTYRKLVERAASRGVLALVAKAPEPMPTKKQPRPSRSTAAIHALNDLIDRSFPPGRVLDFHAPLDARDYFDGLHMNASGQGKRAAEAHAKLSALFAGLPPRAGVRALAWHDGHWSTPGR